MFCAYTRPRYQVSVYRTIGPLVVCSNRNRSALVRDLLSYNPMLIGQLYEDTSLALPIRD